MYDFLFFDISVLRLTFSDRWRTGPTTLNKFHCNNKTVHINKHGQQLCDLQFNIAYYFYSDKQLVNVPKPNSRHCKILCCTVLL